MSTYHGPGKVPSHPQVFFYLLQQTHEAEIVAPVCQERCKVLERLRHWLKYHSFPEQSLDQRQFFKDHELLYATLSGWVAIENATLMGRHE